MINREISSLRKIYNQFIEAVIILNKDGIIQWVSPSIYYLLGYRQEELTGSDIFQLVYRTSSEKAKSIYREFQQFELPVSEGLKQIYRKDGTKAALFVSISNLLHHPEINGMLIQLRQLENIRPKKLSSAQVERIEREVRKNVKQEIAADLHDHINPSLIGLKLLLEYSLKDPSKNYDELEKSASILGELIRDIRDFSNSLVKERDDEFDLHNALQSLLSSFKNYAALRIVLKYDHRVEPILRVEQKSHLLRIIKEQVANIVKHSGASKALICFQLLNGRVIVTTRDNGKGFDSSNRSDGIGFSNMLYRVNGLRGNLHINSRPGGGTLIKIAFPMD